MSDWLAKRREYEEERARAAGMERVADPPESVRAAVPDSLARPRNEGMYETFEDDAYAYRAVSTGDDCVFFRARKSDYYTTTRNAGVCPDCQSTVRRSADEPFLACRRCEWTVGHRLWRWIRYPSWISYLATSVRG
ncbi:hypothetical protein ACFQJD_12045 [Haloplanus sp. GCM10025708]|uniref:hypothetical protein n=1 Tax=Haloferacaceae TaxID=1644056 RepID=UPI00361EB218